MIGRSTCALLVLCLLSMGSLAMAADLMPDFANVPTGWVTDRYAPNSFANVGTYMGRNNVLGIENTSAQNLANRLPGYNSTFYNTLGKQHAISGGAGNSIQAALYIPSSWSDAANGNVRTDMWGVMTDGSSVSGYPIIGFTNYGGAARLRVWEDDAPGGWVDLATPISYDGWTAFGITFTGSAYVYTVNGNFVHADNTVDGTTGFSAVIMQVYNFADPSISGATIADYTAHWSNVPEPGFYGALALGFSGLLLAAKRRRRAARS